MKLQTRLLLAQLPLALALTLLALLAVTSLTSLGVHAQSILKDNYRSVLAAQQLKESLERLDSGALFMLAGEREAGVQLLTQHRPRFEQSLQVAQDNITEPGEKERVESLTLAWKQYETALTQYLTLQSTSEQKTFYFMRLSPAFLSLKEQADAVLTLNQDAMIQRSDRVERLIDWVRPTLGGAAAGALLLGALLSSWLMSRLLRPLNILTQAAERLGRGDLQARAQVSGGDELTQLADAFNRMAERLGLYQQSSLGQLLQAQQAAQAAIDSIPDPVLLFDVKGRVLNFNQAAEQLLGLELVSQVSHVLERVEPNLRRVLEQVCAHVMRGEGPYHPRGFEEAVLLHAEAGVLALLPRAEPVYGGREGLQGVTVILQDVTRLRRFDELKNDMVATVAHEFRTPLTSLRMAIHLCVEGVAGPLTDKQEALLSTAREDCERLQTTVDELLDLARLQSGKLELNRSPLSLSSFLPTVMSAAMPLAREKQVLLKLELLPGLPEVRWDVERMRVVFSNLIGNAIRHTPAGGQIIIHARVEGEQVLCEVSDTGEGIPSSHQAQVLEPFMQGPSPARGGIGLGLSICQGILHAHGGAYAWRAMKGRAPPFPFAFL